MFRLKLSRFRSVSWRIGVEEAHIRTHLCSLFDVSQQLTNNYTQSGVTFSCGYLTNLVTVYDWLARLRLPLTPH